MSDHYEVLGVDPNASREQIRQAYRREIKACHPDRPDGDPERARALDEARTVLLNPMARAQYDAHRAKDSLVEDTVDALAGVAERAVAELNKTISARSKNLIDTFRATLRNRAKP